jgi:anti-sigma-K factor RskA
MNENEIKELLPLYAIDALDDTEKHAVEEYLSAHPELRKELEGLNNTVDSLSSLNMKAPEGILDSIMDDISEPSFAERIKALLFPSGTVQRLSYAAALLLLLYVGIASMDSSSVIALSGTDASSGATGKLVIEKRETEALLTVANLPALGISETYQLWLIKADGERDNGGTFNVSNGKAQLKISAKQPIAEYFAFGITIEPAGGSPAPTGRKVLGS